VNASVEVMRKTLAIVIAAVAVVGAVSVAAAGPLASSGAGPDATGSDAADGSPVNGDGVGVSDATPPNESNASMGAEVSAFMQANAAEANASVDSGMFASAWNHSNATAEQLVTARANALENRLAALQRQKERLLAKQDQLPEVAYKAQMTRLAARIDAIQRAINATSDRARAAGVNTTRLDTLRSEARNLTGPEIAAIARNLSAGVGPPPHAGPPGRNGAPGQNGTPGGPPGENATGDGAPGENETAGGPPGGNDSASGPPADAGAGDDGNETDNESSAGQPDEPGSDTGNATDGNETDGNETDAVDTDGNESDADDTDGNESVVRAPPRFGTESSVFDVTAVTSLERAPDRTATRTGER
jgi:hypothetical protein